MASIISSIFGFRRERSSAQLKSQSDKSLESSSGSEIRVQADDVRPGSGPSSSKPGFFRHMRREHEGVPRLNLSTLKGSKTKGNFASSASSLKTPMSGTDPLLRPNTTRDYMYSIRGYQTLGKTPYFQGSILMDNRTPRGSLTPRSLVRTRRGSVYGEGTTSLGLILRAFFSNDATVLLRPKRVDMMSNPVFLNEQDAISIGGLLISNTTVTSLSVCESKFGSIGAVAMAEALQYNTTLVSLQLKQCGIEVAGAVAISTVLAGLGTNNNTTLTHLDLTNNRIGNFGLACVSKAIKTNTTLKSLTIANDPSIKEEGFAALFVSLRHNKRLDSLKIQMMQECPKACRSFDKLMCGGLKSLDLSESMIEGQNIAILCAAIDSVQSDPEKTPELRSLNLRNVRMEEEGATYLSQTLGSNTFLTNLDLSYNNLLVRGGIYIVRSLRWNRTLVSIDMSENDLGDIGAAKFAESLNEMSLETLILNDNYITCTGAQTMACGLATSTRLTKLCMANNKIENDGMHAMANVVAKNCVLRSLDLEGNSMKDSAAIAFADALGKTNVLLELHLPQVGKDAAILMCEAIRSMPRPPGFRLTGACLADAAETLGYPRELWAASDTELVAQFDHEHGQKMIAFAMGGHPRLGPAYMQALGENMNMILQFVWGYSESGPVPARRSTIIAGPEEQAVVVARIKELCGGGWVEGSGRESLEVSRTHSLDDEEMAPVDMDLI